MLPLWGPAWPMYEFVAAGYPELVYCWFFKLPFMKCLIAVELLEGLFL